MKELTDLLLSQIPIYDQAILNSEPTYIRVLREILPMKTNIRPTKGRVTVEPILEKQSMRGNLFIPNNAQDPSTEGTVVAVSQTDKTELKLGQRVIFARYGGETVRQGNRTFKLLQPNEIFAVIEQD